MRGTTSVVENRDILKELKVGMLVAYNGKSSIPSVAEVTQIPPNPSLESSINAVTFEQERAPHKPKWQRYFNKTDKTCDILLKDIVLYDFKLTKNGAFQKTTRTYLQADCL